MPELSVVVIAQDSEQRAVLQVLVDGTSVARVVHTCTSYPAVVSDPVLRRVQSASPQVVVVDVPADNHTLALRDLRRRQHVPAPGHRKRHAFRRA